MATKTFTHQNGTLAYTDQGAGPLVILAPSLGDLRSEYRFLAPRLVEAGYRAVSLDLRGQGDSSTGWDDYSSAAIAGDLLALVRHLDAGPAILVGTSISGAAVAEAAAVKAAVAEEAADKAAAVKAADADPSLVRGIVMVNAFVRSTIPVWASRLLFTPLFSGPWAASAWVRYYRSLYPAAPPADFETYLADLGANLRQSGRMPAVRRFMTSSKQDVPAALAQVSVPVLVIMGARDPDFKDPAAEGQFITSLLPGKPVLEIVPDAGHYPHAEQPEATARIILDWAAQLPEMAVDMETVHVA
jgi:pimeloyl-ACP methyl ester carboxylesterase